MRAHDQSSIFSTGGKFHPDYGLLLELQALTLVTRSYALLVRIHLILYLDEFFVEMDVHEELLNGTHILYLYHKRFFRLQTYW